MKTGKPEDSQSSYKIEAPTASEETEFQFIIYLQ